MFTQTPLLKRNDNLTCRNPVTIGYNQSNSITLATLLIYKLLLLSPLPTYFEAKIALKTNKNLLKLLLKQHSI